jgi:hypothetical protein
MRDHEGLYHWTRLSEKQAKREAQLMFESVKGNIILNFEEFLMEARYCRASIEEPEAFKSTLGLERSGSGISTNIDHI